MAWFIPVIKIIGEAAAYLGLNSILTEFKDQTRKYSVADLNKALGTIEAEAAKAGDKAYDYIQNKLGPAYDVVSGARKQGLAKVNEEKKRRKDEITKLQDDIAKSTDTLSKSREAVANDDSWFSDRRKKNTNTAKAAAKSIEESTQKLNNILKEDIKV